MYSMTAPAATDYAMMKLALQDALQRISDLVDTIERSQGWQEALASDDPGNVTVWIGPRLAQIRKEAEDALA
jgi:hypothetical protein